MRLSKFYSLALSGLLFPAMTSAVPAINLSAGWNLVGNSDPTSIDVAVGLSDKATITSVWKWNKTAGRWAFFTPAMTLSDLSAYAASKGYDVLTSIDPKDGYWVNAAAPVTSITPPPAVDGVRLSDTDLVTGWTLVASADRKTPSQLNAGWAAALAASGRAVATAWAWDAATNTWKFYAPSLESQGATALSDYITKKGYQPFTAALSSTEGFWVNVANITSASTSTTSTTSTTVTQVTTTTIANTTTTTSGTASANGVTGKTLYSAYCANCHGASFANAKNASLTLSAITTGRGGMGGLSASIKAQQAADIAYYLTYGATSGSTTATTTSTTVVGGTVTTTTGSVTTTTLAAATGQALYTAYCANCHGSRFSNATSSSKTLSAIASNKGGMAYLSGTIQSQQAAAIASYLSSLTGSSSGTKTEDDDDNSGSESSQRSEGHKSDED